MSYCDFFRAYKQANRQWPYPIPNENEPGTNASHLEFLQWMRLMNRRGDLDLQISNLIRASYEYLAGPEEKAVSMSQVYEFVKQPWQNLLTELTTYQPVFPWLALGNIVLPEQAARAYSPGLELSMQKASYYLSLSISFSTTEPTPPLTAEQQETQRAEWAQREADRLLAMSKQTIPPMTYPEFSKSYWTAGNRWPYLVASYRDASPSPSFHEFQALMQKMGRAGELDGRGPSLLRACYEYLAGPEGKAVELLDVYAFLSQPYPEAILLLKSYQPVFHWLMLAGVTEPDMIRGLNRGLGSFESAGQYVEDCLAYPEQEERERLATEQAATERATYAAEVEANIRRLVQEDMERERHVLRKQVTDTLWQAVIVFLSMVAGFIVGQNF